MLYVSVFTISGFNPTNNHFGNKRISRYFNAMPCRIGKPVFVPPATKVAQVMGNG
jgi:hypothetical protein